MRSHCVGIALHIRAREHLSVCESILYGWLCSPEKLGPAQGPSKPGRVAAKRPVRYIESHNKT